MSGTTEGERHRSGKSAGGSRKTLSAILNGRAGISPEMAVRLSIAFGTSAESWLNQQTQYDLWHAEQRRKKLRVRKACRLVLFTSTNCASVEFPSFSLSRAKGLKHLCSL
jgi:addiction module HigA family antidote